VSFVVLAKEALDVGLFTNDLEAHMAFWGEQLRLPYEGRLKLGGGIHQHRYICGESVIKVNASRNPLPGVRRPGLLGLRLLTPQADSFATLLDPDGTKVDVVPCRSGDAIRMGLSLAVCNVAPIAGFLQGVLGAVRAGATTFRIGSTSIELQQTSQPPFWEPLEARGLRYLTVQVRDIDGSHRGALAGGALELRPPVTMGERARISFIADPEGNWIELSQRNDLSPLQRDRTHPARN
jgi:lactoylglutathione lyase